jgi:hypothetical protein
MYGTDEERAHQGSDDLTAVSVARVGFDYNELA